MEINCTRLLAFKQPLALTQVPVLLFKLPAKQSYFLGLLVKSKTRKDRRNDYADSEQYCC